MKKYTYTEKTYALLAQLREMNPNAAIPVNATPELLEKFGIVVGEVPDSQEYIEAMQKVKAAKIDAETSAAILVGFDYEIGGEKLHFSYDSFDQQNFADTANACLLAKSGVPNLPQSVTWNGYEADGTLKRLELDADAFLALYTAGALAHKAACMEAGGAKKAALLSQEPTC